MKILLNRFVVQPLKRLIEKLIKKPIRNLKKRIWSFINLRIFRRYTTLVTETKFKCKYYSSFRRKRTAVSNRVHWYIQNLEREKNKDKRLSIVFICQFHAAWNACMSTFQEAMKDPNIEVILLALPEKEMRQGKSKRVSDITAEIYGEENIAYEYCKSFFPETINGYDREKDTWFDLHALNPDYVVLSRSNQNYLPAQYRAEVLCTYTKVVHIPYAYCKMNWDSRAVYRENLADYTYAIFTENKMYQEMLRIIYHDLFAASWKKIEFFGYPRFDMYNHENRQEIKNPKTVLWLPRWVTEGRLEASTFFKYKDILISFFLDHPEYKLICRPHPKMFGNFIATGEMSETEVIEFKKLFAETSNFYLDEYSDYLPSFEDADIYISDTTSLLVEEFITGKPIIFCGVMSHFDMDAKNWACYMYLVHNRQGLISQLTSLLNGNDPQKLNREDYIKNGMKHDGNCGKRIVEFLKNDYYNS